MLDRADIKQLMRAAGASVLGRPASKYEVRRQDGTVVPWSVALRAVRPGEQVVILVYDGVADNVVLEQELPLVLDEEHRAQYTGTPPKTGAEPPHGGTDMAAEATVDFISVILGHTVSDAEPEGNAELATEIDDLINNAPKGLKDPKVIKAIAAHQRTDAVTKPGLYKALMAAQKDAAPAPKAVPKKGKKAVPKKGKKGKKAKPETTRKDGFKLKKVECVEGKIVAPIGVAWRRDCAMYKLHAFLAEGNLGDEAVYYTMDEVKAHLPELKSVARYVKECETEVKIGPCGWKFERVTAEGEADQIRIYPNPEFTVQDGCDLLD